MNEENKQHEITVVNSDGEKLSLNLHWDSDIFEWLRIFKVILKWITFADKTINENIIDEDSEIEENQN